MKKLMEEVVVGDVIVREQALALSTPIPPGSRWRVTKINDNGDCAQVETELIDGPNGFEQHGFHSYPHGFGHSCEVEG